MRQSHKAKSSPSIKPSDAELEISIVSPELRRVLVEFQSDIRIPDLDVKLGVAGVGTRLPSGCSAEKAREIISMLNRRLVRQSAFAFIAGLDNRGLMEIGPGIQDPVWDGNRGRFWPRLGSGCDSPISPAHADSDCGSGHCRQESGHFWLLRVCKRKKARTSPDLLSEATPLGVD